MSHDEDCVWMRHLRQKGASWRKWRETYSMYSAAFIVRTTGDGGDRFQSKQSPTLLRSLIPYLKLFFTPRFSPLLFKQIDTEDEASVMAKKEKKKEKKRQAGRGGPVNNNTSAAAAAAASHAQYKHKHWCTYRETWKRREGKRRERQCEPHACLSDALVVLLTQLPPLPLPMSRDISRTVSQSIKPNCEFQLPFLSILWRTDGRTVREGRKEEIIKSKNNINDKRRDAGLVVSWGGESSSSRSRDKRSAKLKKKEKKENQVPHTPLAFKVWRWQWWRWQGNANRVDVRIHRHCGTRSLEARRNNNNNNNKLR